MFGVLHEENFEMNFDSVMENNYEESTIMNKISQLFEKIADILYSIKIIKEKEEVFQDRIIRLEKKVEDLESMIKDCCIVISD